MQAIKIPTLVGSLALWPHKLHKKSTLVTAFWNKQSTLVTAFWNKQFKHRYKRVAKVTRKKGLSQDV
eukprot:1145510-Pelagomonas_calceolata.AAC.3